MARKPLTAEEKLIALLAKDASAEEEAKLKKITENKKVQQTADESAIEAEAVLLYFNTKGAGFTKQNCPECSRLFAVKYHIPKHKMCCSNSCRRSALKKIGIEWNPNKTPEERWGMQGQTRGIIPLTVPPDALEIVESKLQEIDDRNTVLQT